MIPNSSQNVATKAVGPRSVESIAEDSLKLSEENAMPIFPVMFVSKKGTVLVKHMPILTMPKYKLKLCIPDMLNFTKEAFSAVPDFTTEHKEHGMVFWDDPIDVRSLNIDICPP